MASKGSFMSHLRLTPIVAGRSCNVARVDNYVTINPVRDTFMR